MRKQRILVLVHPQFRPDLTNPKKGTEYDVWQALRKNHQVEVCTVQNDLKRLDADLARVCPAVVFNLAEEFRGEAVFDFHLVSYLEARGIPVTGCNPRGLIQSRNKFLVTNLASSMGVKCPRTYLADKNVLQQLKRHKMDVPVFVKLNREHASLGIRESNRVQKREKLRAEVQRMSKTYGGETLVQEFIPGFDVSVSVWGNHRPEVFHPRRLYAGGADRTFTERIKFNRKAQMERSVRSTVFRHRIAARLMAEAKLLYKVLDMSGYGRFDYRVDAHGESYLIDVNANPNLARGEDFVASTREAGMEYLETLERIVRLAKNYCASF